VTHSIGGHCRICLARTDNTSGFCAGCSRGTYSYRLVRREHRSPLRGSTASPLGVIVTYGPDYELVPQQRVA